MSNVIVCHFDGACEPQNPGGNMGMGAVIKRDGKILSEYSRHVAPHPDNTNNVAEYSALIAVLEYLIEHKLNGEKVQIYGDSLLVVNQMKGSWKVKSGRYYEFAKKAKELFKQFSNTTINWVPREQNTEADDLSKRHTT